MLILGYDPGGLAANGVAIIEDSPDRQRITTATLDSAAEVLDWFHCNVVESGTPDAVGIDTLLSWSMGRAGWRPMDLWLRKIFKPSMLSVQTPSRLQGCMTINGMAVAMGLRERWPSITLNETHPKVLCFAKTGMKYEAGAAMEWMRRETGATPANDDEADALMSALLTRNALSGAWPCDDLMALDDCASLVRPAGAVVYYWPKQSPHPEAD